MSGEQTTAKQQKLNFFEAFNKALQLVRLSFRGTFVYAFVIALLNQLLTLGFINTFSLSEDKIVIGTPSLFALYLLLMFLEMLVGNCFILIRQNATIHGKKINFKQTLFPILDRLPGIFVSGIAFSILSILGMGLHVVPGVLFITCFYVYLPSLIFAHKKAFESWRYSFSLIKKHFFSTLALVLMSLILLWIPPAIAEFLGNAFSDSNTYFGVEITGMILLTALILLLMNAMNIVWFYLLHKNKQ